MSLSLDPSPVPFLDHPAPDSQDAYPVADAPRVLYVDVDDDLPGLLDRVEEDRTPAIVVLPQGARAIRGMVAARLLQRRADAAGIPLVAVTSDRTTIAQLRGVHIATAATVGEARRLLPGAGAGSPAPEDRPDMDMDMDMDMDTDPDMDMEMAAEDTSRSPARLTALSRPAALPADDEDPAATPYAAKAAGIDAPADAAAAQRVSDQTPVVQVRVARMQPTTAARGGHRLRYWLAGTLLLAALTGFGAWVYLFPQATIVISYAATTLDRGYRIVAGSTGSLPVHTTHLDVSGTLTVPATGTTQVPYGHATGTVTFANPLAGYVQVPYGTEVTTGDGIAYTTLAAVAVPPAQRSFSGTTNGQQSVQVEAVAPGPGSNVAAGAVVRVLGRLAGVLLVTNYNPIAGGTLRTIYSITQQDTDAAAATLRATLPIQGERTLRQRYAQSPARAITGIYPGAPRVTSIAQGGRLYARVSLTVRLTMDYLHAQDVQHLRALKGQIDLSGKNLAVVPGSEQVTVHVARAGKQFVATVHVHAQVVPTIDTTNLRGLLTGRTVAEARQLLDASSRYGNWRYTLNTTPDWGGRMPQMPDLIRITVRQSG